MRKKIVFFALVAISIAILASCDLNTTHHNHSFSRTWTVTETEHWKDSNCGHDLVSNKGEHSWDNGKETKSATEEEEGEFTYTCKVCKHTKTEVIFRIPHTHTFGGEFLYNDKFHWQAATCEHSDYTSPAEAHRFSNNECFICHYLADSEGLSYTERKDGTYSVSGKGDFAGTKVVIPDTYNGMPVTAISRNAFTETPITKVVIPASVTSIGAGAFNNCSSLTSVEWKDGDVQLASIGDYAFSNIKIKSFTIPKTVTYIGNCAFYASEPIEEIIVEEGNQHYKSENGALYTADGKTLMQYALANKQTSFTVPNTVTSMHYGAFACCYNLEEIVFEEGSTLTKIPERAFDIMSSLKKISLPSSVTYLSDYAFNNCRKLEEINVPDGVTYIGDHAFFGCSSVAPFDLPAEATEIGSNAFSECNQFVNLVIPDKVIKIGDEAFLGCRKLETVSIPKSTSKFGKRVFMSCESLVNITVENDNPTLRSIEGNLYNKAATGLVCYCVGKTNEEFTVPEGVTSLYALSLYSAKKLKRVNLPSTLEIIRKEAFRYCYALEEIIIPNKVTLIEEDVFFDCTSLASVKLSTGLTSLPSNLFRGCKSLAEITIPANIKTINPLAFSVIQYLKRATFEVTEGWHYLSPLEGAEYLPFDPADIADPEKAAKFLTDTTLNHYNHIWKLNP